MFVTVDERDARPLYQQLVDEIKTLIARGELEAGDAVAACQAGGVGPWRVTSIRSPLPIAACKKKASFGSDTARARS